MKPSKDCIDLVKSFEGYHRELSDGNASAYLDPVLIPTIGWGTIQYPDGKKVIMGDIRTRKQCEQYLQHEIDGKAAAVDKLVTVDITQSMFDALVSFAYNVGVGALGESTLLRLLNTKDYEGAAAQFPRWVKARLGVPSSSRSPTMRQAGPPVDSNSSNSAGWRGSPMGAQELTY
jgi:lysozyme